MKFGIYLPNYGAETSARNFAEVGMTWWLESMFSVRNSHEKLISHIKQGPPDV